MKITTVQTDGKAVTTGKYMRYIVNRYCNDMLPYVHLSLLQVFEKIKRLPFVPDPPDRELLMRPAYTMTDGGDCDDKAIALASYCRLLKTPCRFIASRRKGAPVLHHVFCEIYLVNKWVHADPTYSFNPFGRERESFVEYQQI